MPRKFREPTRDQAHHSLVEAPAGGRVEVISGIGDGGFDFFNHGSLPVVDGAPWLIDEAHFPRNTCCEAALFGPLRMGFETMPGVLLKQFLSQPNLRGARIIHSLAPSGPVIDFAAAERAGCATGVALRARMPDPRRAVCVARRATEHVLPEHVALNVLESRLHVAFITGLAHQHRHGRLHVVGVGQDLNR